MATLPDSLITLYEKFIQDWQDAASPEEKEKFNALFGNDDSILNQLKITVTASRFVAQRFITQPALVFLLIDDTHLNIQNPFDADDIASWVNQRLTEAKTEAEFDKSIRLARRDFMLRVIWRDLNRIADVQETTRELSAFADACINAALNYHHSLIVEEMGCPVSESTGQAQPLLVLGMGKLGACELNLSSDIDLIFAYPDTGNTVGGKRSVSNQEFFNRLGQLLIKSLDATTADGFVFRVDMRLRPYGQSGPLVTNYDFLENYYQTQGREWERYAMIKARVVAGTSNENLTAGENKNALNAVAAGAQLMAMLQPFTYRKYIDYSAIEALRSMKQLITREVARKGLKTDVKLGAGGIREVEFIVQVFQLIRGGRDTRFQERHVLKMLPLLAEEHCLPEGVDKILADAYIFLRNTEHAIQAYQDRQTQKLPIDKPAQQALAMVMDFDDWDKFCDALENHRKNVSQQFAQLIADPSEKETTSKKISPEWHLLWLGELNDDAVCQLLAYCGDQAEAIQSHLKNLRENPQVLAMQAAAREKLDQLMPHLLEDIAAYDNAEITLQRVSQIISAVARRSVYIVLLLENPAARNQLVKLCAASVLIGEQLAKHPALLDELLDVSSLYTLPDHDQLRDELRREALRISWDDLEGHMEMLRYFKLAHGLRVAASEVSGALPLMKVSDYLTFLAEVILEHVLELAWQQMTAQYGAPCDADGHALEKEFIIVGYGKLGGIELGHGSDLDLVFIHNANINCHTDGERQIDNATFFMRLGQKIIHILNTQTWSGQLYEVDMRLRPSGNSGLLVSSLNAFENYQFKEAWTWEHQALVRARVVAGSDELARQFEALRKRVLTQQRDSDTLRTDVVEMREKMRKQLGTKPAKQDQEFQVKQDAGGIVDIEFMVQYAVLAWASEHPTLTTYTDNIRILSDLVDAGLLESERAEQLTDAYKAYRTVTHRLALQGLPGVVSPDEFPKERQQVQTNWQQFFG